MSQREFEDHIRRELHGHSTPVDGEALWNQIQPQLHKRRRRGFFWLWLLAGALVLSAAASWLVSNSVSDHPEQQNNAVTAQAAETEGEVSLEESLTSPGNAPSPAEAGVFPALPSPNGTLADRQADARRTAGVLPGSAKDKNESPKIPGSGLRQAASASPEKQASPLGLKPPKTTDQPDEKSVEALANEGYDARPEDPTGFLPAPSPADGAIIAFDTPAELSDSYTILLNKPWPLPAYATPAVPSIATREARRKKDWTLALGLQGGIASSTKNLQAKTEEAAAYRERRKTSEKSLEVLTAGADLWFHHRLGLYARTGLHLSQVTEQFGFDQITLTTDTTTGIVEILINANGDSTFVDGIITLQRETHYKKRTYNTLRLFDVPLIVGYELQQAPFSFGVEVGALFNFKLSAEGDVLAEDEAAGYLTLAESDMLRSSVGLSYFAALRINYHLGENWQLSVSPYFRYFPGSFTQDADPLEQTYRFLGGQLGVKYYLK